MSNVIGNHPASSKLTNLIVLKLRAYFGEVDKYAPIFGKAYSALSTPIHTTDGGLPIDYYLISSSFPERFAYYPYVGVNVATPNVEKLTFISDNLLVSAKNKNQANWRGGLMNTSAVLSIAALNRLDAERMSEIIQHYFLTEGATYFRLNEQLILAPPTIGSIRITNFNANSPSITVYTTDVSFQISGQWSWHDTSPEVSDVYITSIDTDIQPFSG